MIYELISVQKLEELLLQVIMILNSNKYDETNKK